MAQRFLSLVKFEAPEPPGKTIASKDSLIQLEISVSATYNVLWKEYYSKLPFWSLAWV
jgi:hypothetical protein